MEPQGELLPVQVYAGGKEREADKPMTVRLQWWHWSRKTVGLPWIPAAAEELGGANERDLAGVQRGPSGGGLR